jgi:DNA-binding MarR family transcriptional regulator
MRLEDLPKDPMVAVWVAVARAESGLIARIAADGKAAGHPPLEWYDVLWELERNGGALRPFELERGLLLAQYNLSRLIERMSQAGYVEKRPCPTDRRGQVIVVTQAGKAVRKGMWPTYLASIQRHIGAHLSETEAKTLCRLLIRFVSNPDELPA